MASSVYSFPAGNRPQLGSPDNATNSGKVRRKIPDRGGKAGERAPNRALAGEKPVPRYPYRECGGSSRIEN